MIGHLLAVAGGGGGGGGTGGHGSSAVWPVAIIGALWIVAGVAMLVAPRRMFRIGMWSNSWMFAQRPEPSQRYLQVQRVVALLAIPAGVALVVVGILHR